VRCEVIMRCVDVYLARYKACLFGIKCRYITFLFSA